MARPYEMVISIGGQSLVDGIWRLFGPALEDLVRPLPLVLPGFTNAVMRIEGVVPVQGSPPPTGAFAVLASVALTAEAMLQVNVSTGEVTVPLGPRALDLSNLTGTINLPAHNVDLTNLAIGGNIAPPIGRVDLSGGTGSLSVPAGAANLTGGQLEGTINLPDALSLGLPLPAVVPVALDLTPAPLAIGASLVLAVAGIDWTTRYGMQLNVSGVTLDPIHFDPNALVGQITSVLQAAADQIQARLDLPTPEVPLEASAVSGLLSPIPAVVGAALVKALSGLTAETGRLLYPPAGTGASCDVAVLPTAGDGRLTVAASGTYILQVGLIGAGAPATSRTGRGSSRPASSTATCSSATACCSSCSVACSCACPPLRSPCQQRRRLRTSGAARTLLVATSTARHSVSARSRWSAASPPVWTACPAHPSPSR